MLKHLIFISFVLLSSGTFSQNTDSLFVSDSTKTADSLKTLIADSTEVPDSLREILTAKKDTLDPIQGVPLTDASAIINKRTFLFTNYRYTGDLLRSFSFNFIKDLGFIGQPHETFIYGVGNNGISFLRDGVLLNNRLTNSLDLNLVQSEDIDSIEIVPSPRGFLYGPYNNPVTVNFITRDFVSSEPYSRIKYYEGPDGEAMIDGKFNSQIMKRWNLSFQATNRSVDETYTNSEFGIWQVNAKLKYFLSNSVNISGSYYFISANQGLNGGVDFDSLTQISDNPKNDLYDPSIAPVLYPNRKLDIIQHNFNLRTLAKPFEDSKLDLSVYYRYNEDKIENAPVTFFDNQETRTYGGSLLYDHQELDILQLQIGTSYDKNNTIGIKEDSISSKTSEYSYNYFSAYVLLCTNLFDELIQPSVFYKYENILWERISITNEYVRRNSGIGGDVQIVPSNNVALYFGYSRFAQYDVKDVETFEAGVNFTIEGLVADLKYFSRNNFTSYNILVPWWTSYEIGYSIQNVKGLGCKLDYKFWVILLESDLSYYFDIYNTGSSGLPNIQFKGGLFVNDYFFEDNLNLKSGFVFHYTGEIPGSFTSGVVAPSNKLDFILAGEIRGAAIFYFIWENLFGNQYYITPYYPMPERNIRFGLAWELFN